MDCWIRFALDPGADPSSPDHSGLARYGVLDGEEVIERRGLNGAPTGRRFPVAEARILPPCSPTKIVCVGRNYAGHAKELNNPIPEEPLIFLKPPSSLIAHEDRIILPQVSQLVHHEAELAVILNKRARKLTRQKAMECVWGFTCLNDVTARDIQKKEGKFTRAKGVDTFCPVGPCVVPKEQVDLDSLRVICRVNGEVRQDAPVSDLIFKIEEVLWFITQTMTLEPCDVIATGTPAGVGPLVDGDVVEVEIPGIGVLRNSVVREC